MSWLPLIIFANTAFMSGESEEGDREEYFSRMSAISPVFAGRGCRGFEMKEAEV